MKKYIFLFTFLVSTLSSCVKKQKQKKKEIVIENIVKKEFQNILDSVKVGGTILIFDSQKNTYYSNNFEEAKTPYLPASTFKIPNSIIGLETGILENKNTVFTWNGESRAMPVWEKDLTLQQAFQVSCVPCYQELARKIGVQRMNTYLKKLQFGVMDVNNTTLDNFWLMGNSKITPFEQIDFLQRLYNGKLPISESTLSTIQSIMKIKSADTYVMSGKTGLAIVNNRDVGWFVGYVEIGNNVFYFATKVFKNDNMPRSNFVALRKAVTISALKTLHII